MAAAQGSLTSRKCLAASRSSAAPTRLQPLRVATVARPIVESPTSPQDSHLRIPVVQDQNQLVRVGHYEAALVRQQASKPDSGQDAIASSLHKPDMSKLHDAVVVGAGPAGMYLAAELAKRGLSTVLVGLDMPLVNNYGVWTDEFKALGLEHTLERSWPDASCFFGEGKPVRLGRGYGRVSRRKLREHLVAMCAEAGVAFLAAEVDSLQVAVGGGSTTLSMLHGGQLRARLVTLAAGAAAGKFLRYEEGAPSVASQTAYGIEAEVEGYHEAFPGNEMLFMDFRRHHTGVWEQSAPKIRVGSHPNAGDGEWGTSGEVPSFLYAMPLGGDRVFLEETCLVAKLMSDFTCVLVVHRSLRCPFAVLKRRLERRMAAHGIRVKKVHEEEWSYIPVGGPLPKGDQAVAAFGAAANLVHPATGFSVSRSFREAPRVADELAACIRAGLGVRQASARVWSTLWPQEKRTQTAFHVFGMELLATLDLASTNAFFGTFFKLPSYYWRGYMASQLSSGELIIFALLTFALANNDIRAKLMVHLFSDPAGRYLLDAYVKRYRDSPSPSPSSSPSSSLSALPPPAPAPAVEVKLPASLEPNQA
ncbi:hypothetical protein QJQ45_027358 [Haematococcus lacustris]|nr:hypothetical protein QJQ45_027358 [Haematococcus lacustris]